MWISHTNIAERVANIGYTMHLTMFVSANVDLMTGIVGSGSSWVYYTSGDSAPSDVTSGQSTSGDDDVFYMTSAGSESTATYGTTDLYPLCEIQKEICAYGFLNSKLNKGT